MTIIATGSALARKLYSVALFSQAIRGPSFRKNMIGPAPKQKAAEAKLKGQTSPDYPFVQVNDLSKTAGEKVSVDLFNIVSGKPVMGDAKLAGKMMGLTSSSMDITINQYRAGVDPGGRMTQQRTVHDLRGIALANLEGYMNRLEDQLCFVHVAGQRGYQNDRDWVVPLESDGDFTSIMVNTVMPPSRNRRFFGGNATTASNIDSADIININDLDRLRANIDDMAFPMQPIRMEGDPDSDENPLYVMYVTGRQWYQLQISTATQNWRTFLANAHARSAGFNHPLFKGETGMWAGIVVKKMRRAIRFGVGQNVKELDASDVSQNVVAAVATDRALLMGAQALALVYGRHAKSDYYVSWHEEETDHGNVIEFSAATMGGKSKLRFTDPDGNLTDHGVITVDSYAPAA